MINIFGVTNFSVLIKNKGKFLLANESHKEYIQKLFNPSRLSLRFEMFSKMTIPSLSLMEKEGINYKHFVVYSNSLPDCFKSKLLDISYKYSFIELIGVEYLDELNIREYMLRFFKEKSQKKSIFGYFSLDDDDVLSVDYLQRMKKYLNKSFVGMNIVFSKGYTTYYEKETDYLLLREVRFPFINIGQMRICEYDGDKGIFIPATGSHMLTDLSVPTVIDSTNYSFIWLRHLSQDTSSTFNNIEYIKKINIDLNRYPVTKYIDFQKFPLIKNYIYEKKLIGVYSKILLSIKNEDKILIENLSNFRTLIINYETISNYSIPKLALIRFIFSRELTASEMVKSGLIQSRKGYYRYLASVKEKNKDELLVEVPHDVSILAISVCKWGDKNLLIEKLEIEGLQKASNKYYE